MSFKKDCSMIELGKGWVYTLKINAPKVNILDIFRLSQYSSYQGKNAAGMVKSQSTTLLINLNLPAEELLQGCKSNTRNEIRRAIREDFFFERVEFIDEFVNYYNNFALDKGLKTIQRGDLEKYGDHLILFKSGKDDITMTMHASIVDFDIKRVSLLYSASIRLDDGIDRKSVGFSNRFLHFKEFLAFKEMGYETYDFSGVCLDPSDNAKYQIGLFKQSFGGDITPAVRLYSFPMALIMKIRTLL